MWKLLLLIVKIDNSILCAKSLSLLVQCVTWNWPHKGNPTKTMQQLRPCTTTMIYDLNLKYMNTSQFTVSFRSLLYIRTSISGFHRRENILLEDMLIYHKQLLIMNLSWNCAQLYLTQLNHPGHTAGCNEVKFFFFLQRYKVYSLNRILHHGDLIGHHTERTVD